MTTTAHLDRSQTGTRLSRIGTWTAFGIAALVALQGAFLLFLGFDKTNFADAAGIEWDQLVANSPITAEYLSQGSADRIFAVTALGLGLQTAILIYLATRQRQTTSRTVLFILPAVLIGWALILMPSNQNSIAIPSLALGLLMALALALAGKTVGAPTP